MAMDFKLTFSDYIDALEAMRNMTSKERMAILSSYDVEATYTAEVIDQMWGEAKDAATWSDPNDGRSGRAR